MTQPPDDATRAQIHAADPNASTWVSANAGSGKTRVLTDRVARLLLRGTDPTSILCLTYTKAAAAEMQNRLFRRLGSWSMLADAPLRAELGSLGETGQAVEAAQLARARTLFARALETPGGLRIQTIHSFCEQILRRFPLEAGVAPRFELLEDRQAAQVRGDLLEELAGDPDSGFDALAPHILSLDQSLDALLTEILRHRTAFARLPDPARLAAAIGGGEHPVDPAARILTALPDTRLDAVVAAVAAAGGSYGKAAIRTLDPLRQNVAGAAEACFEAFLARSSDWNIRKNLVVRKLQDKHPEAAADLLDLAAAVQATRAEFLCRQVFERSRALGQFAHHFVSAYAARKDALGRLDYDDLIDKARALLASSAAGWVMFKLDGGIDHVLVDEAQDTSPSQWQVIDALSAEFFSGAGQRDTLRTIFVVGDLKQSIYSFQGADPEAFRHQKTRYRERLEDFRQILEERELIYSFRSARPILQLVDAVFADAPGAAFEENARHVAFREALPGRVELWPLIEPPEKVEDAPWFLPVDQPPPEAAQIVLARQVADRIETLLTQRRVLPGTTRAVRPGDFLILVQTRGTLFRGILAELKSRGLAVAGADRLKLGDNLAVNDLMSMVRFLVTPDDDLSLAEVLRSPLVGLDEAALYTLAQGREGTLFTALRQSRDHVQAAELILDLRGQADFLRPFEILDRVLTRHGARARIRARLGAEADEAVDALLDLALAYEQIEPPSLTGFLDWMSGGDAEIKRQPDTAADEIRIMTVHGAKGLESPIVILPQTLARPPAGRGVSLVSLAHDQVTLPPGKDGRTERISAALEREAAITAEENERLLYVALTRAETWLMIGGAGKPQSGDFNWYQRVSDAVADMPGWEQEGEVLVLQSPDMPGIAEPHPARDAGAAQALPDWLSRPAPAAPQAPAVLTPTRLAQDVETAGHGGTGQGRAAGLARGRWIHLLLEHLPGLPAEARAARAQALLGDAGSELIFDPVSDDPSVAHPPATDGQPPVPPIAELLAEVSAVIDASELDWIFDPGALCEVPVSGRLARHGNQILRGQIDRLILRPDRVVAVDFKSDPVVPAHPPQPYSVQLAWYHAALSEIYPDRQVEVGLLWTRSAFWMPIPHEDVMAALAATGGH